MPEGEGGLRSIDRYGRWALLTVFVVLLAGRFTLDRVGGLPAWDVRWAGVVAVGLLCLVWATTARQRTSRTGTGALFGWFAAWCTWMALTAGWAPHGARLQDGLVDLAFLLGFTWAAWGMAGRVAPRVLGAVWWWLYVAGWIYFAGAIAAGPGVQGRYSAFGGGPNVFVRVMALAFLASLVLAATRQRRWVLIGLVPFTLGAYLSGSRGGLLALVVVLLVGGWPLARRLGARVRGTLLLGALPAVAAASLFYDPSWTSFGTERFLQETQQGYDSGRTAILRRALELFGEHLWTGTGLDGFSVLQHPWTDAEYPHNLVVATAAEGGLVGLGLLVGALGAGAVALLRLRPLGTGAIGFGLAALLVLVASLFSGDYYDTRFLWFFLGLAVIAARHDRASRLAAAPSPRAAEQAVPIGR